MDISYHCHKKLLATGHSLGALATLHILDARINTAFAQYGLYTFASPKVGDIAFRNYYKLQVASSFRLLIYLMSFLFFLPQHKF